MKIYQFITILALFKWSDGIIGPPVKCHGAVPKISEGKYYFHDNETYLLRFSTTVEMKLDINQRSCFQVDVAESEENVNETSKLSSLFYSVRYLAYKQTYDVRTSYLFGIPEFQSFCRCDCPGGQNFCTHDFGHKRCSKGSLCVTKFHSFQGSAGCNLDQDKPSTLCCEISVKPYKDRRFVAISLVDPRPQTEIEIEIYAKYDTRWSLFRKYHRRILPYRGNTLRLNGFENVADMYIRADSDSPQHYLKNGDKWYFYEDKPEFVLYDDTRVNPLFKRDPDAFGWLRYEQGHWTIGDTTLESLHDLQRPRVTNCKEQLYNDNYLINSPRTFVIKNETGAVNSEPFLGLEVSKKQPFVKAVRLSHANFGMVSRDTTLSVEFTNDAAPSLNLDIRLHQKMAVVAHMYASYLEDFNAQICLDKHSFRYLNITLIKSFGQFSIEVFRDRLREEMDLVLSVTTELPFATNYSEIQPLPGFVSSSRLVCVFASNKPSNRLCKWATFVKEPIDWFVLQNTFVDNEGKCPGCNLETRSGGFLSFLNPTTWFDGVNSLTEGLGLALQIVLYVVLLVVLIAVWRKCIWPLVRWAFCSSNSAFELSKIERI